MDGTSMAPLTTLLLALFSGALPTPEPSPRFPRGLAAMELPAPPAELKTWNQASCAGCHPREADAWKVSPHGNSMRSVVFEAAVKREEATWCNGCHAPLSVGADPRSAETLGITCAACHAEEGAVAAVHDVNDEHRSVAAPWLRDPVLCAQCHQFGFPVRNAQQQVERLSTETQQQDTYREYLEWRESTGDTRTCQDCHMPRGDHAMGGIRRVDALRDAVELTWVTPRLLRLSTRHVGHRVPTGDVMRFMSVDIAADETFAGAHRVASFERTLGLGRFTPGAPAHLGVVARSTLPASGMGHVDVTIPARLPNGQAARAWRLTYHLISRGQEADGMFPPGLAQVVVQAGQLPHSP
jgi:hypothetical protein